MRAEKRIARGSSRKLTLNKILKTDPDTEKASETLKEENSYIRGSSVFETP